MLSRILRDAGYTVNCFENGKDAIKASYKELYNIALIDIQLPDMQGTELLTKLRKTEPEIIKIIITGHATLDSAVDAANKGVDGYITKPFRADKLLEMMETQLRKQSVQIEIDEQKVAEYIAARHEWMSNASIQNKK